ncbi:MAG TPA: fasciclin domain-containing protein [Pyrinomonadaceae bacterium]|nr:fasciclin domain-containing protein [Pyrinomonadaceae bacterium]
MKLTKSIGRMIIACGALLSLLAVAGAQPLSAKVEVPGDTAKPANIVETVVAAGQFKTLAAALEAAGLIDALNGEGPFTVFAPTDEAFAKLPAGTLESLLKPENKEKLKSILLYHVVPGNVAAKQVMKLNGRTVKTLEGGSIKVSIIHGVTVDDARVTKTDIQASNGVIHVIDTVLVPKM